MVVCCVYMLCCVGRGLCDGLITRPEESYRVSVCVCEIKKPRKGRPKSILDYKRLWMNEWTLKLKLRTGCSSQRGLLVMPCNTIGLYCTYHWSEFQPPSTRPGVLPCVLVCVIKKPRKGSHRHVICMHCRCSFYSFDIWTSPEDGPIRSETCSDNKNWSGVDWLNIHIIPKMKAKGPSWTISACEWMNEYCVLSMEHMLPSISHI
jgi:hypothetical protein